MIPADFRIPASPIEAEFLSSFCQAAVDNGYDFAEAPGRGRISVRTQFPIYCYKADFLVSFEFFGSALHLVVECDGHDFHERTKRQARHDKQRDRIMSRYGYTVLRFAGSEINDNARRCAMEVLGWIMDFQSAKVRSAAGMEK